MKRNNCVLCALSSRWDDSVKRLTIDPAAKKNAKPRKFIIELIPSGTKKEILYSGQRMTVGL
jgi:hypothetical protein